MSGPVLKSARVFLRPCICEAFLCMVWSKCLLMSVSFNMNLLLWIELRNVCIWSKAGFIYLHTYLTITPCYSISLVLPWKSNDEEARYYKGLGWEFPHSDVLLRITFCHANVYTSLKLPWALPACQFVVLMMREGMRKNLCKRRSLESA